MLTVIVTWFAIACQRPATATRWPNELCKFQDESRGLGGSVTAQSEYQAELILVRSAAKGTNLPMRKIEARRRTDAISFYL